MTLKEVFALKVGDGVSIFRTDKTHLRGEVTVVTDNYVRIDWHADRGDVLSKQSPAWCWIDKKVTT